jgi:hypothetical protein
MSPVRLRSAVAVPCRPAYRPHHLEHAFLACGDVVLGKAVAVHRPAFTVGKQQPG